MEEEKVSSSNQPFHTSNAILAFCLWRAGVEFWDPQEPCMVIYDLSIIRKFTNANGEPIFKGMQLEEAAKKAHERRLRGQVLYVFKPKQGFKELMAAFRDQEDELNKNDVTVHDIVLGICDRWGNDEIGDEEALLRLACVDLKTRVEFMELWQHQVPMIRILNEGEIVKRKELVQTKDGTKLADVVDHPGFKIMSVNASKETREAMGL